ncbi:MAG: YeaC family protein [Pseudomonadota bacterium]
MQFDDLIKAMNQEVYERLVHAVETGKWPDGNRLSDEQRENSIQLVMAYQARYASSGEAFTIGANGEMVTKTKRELKEQFKDTPEESIARFKLDEQEGEL